MFFKGCFLFVLFSALIWPSAVSAQKRYTYDTWPLPIGYDCYSDMTDFYPDLLSGRIGLRQRDRFFRCLHDTLELLAEGNFLTHDQNRDHFTREEVAKIFYHILGYDVDSAWRSADTVLLIKKIFVGGAIDKLRDEEIRLFYNITYDLESAYSYLQPVIPILRKAFSGNGALSEAEAKRAEEAIKQALLVLMRAYQRENLVYRIDDLEHYAHYMSRLGWTPAKLSGAIRSGFGFLHHLIGGLFPASLSVQGSGWPVFMEAFYDSIKVFFYYRTHLSGAQRGRRDYRVLDLVRMVVDLLPIGYQTKNVFPIKSLDGMLANMADFIGERLFSGFFSNVAENLNREHVIPLLTRTLFCFSFNPPDQERPCRAEWGEGEGEGAVTLFFQDAEFALFPDRIEKKDLYHKGSFMLSSEPLKDFRNWLFDYKNSVVDINSGIGRDSLIRRRMGHWLDPFFGQLDDGRMAFGSYRSQTSRDQLLSLLHSQAPLPLFLNAYIPRGYFFEKGGRVSRQTWRDIVREVSPAVMVLTGSKGYTLEHKASWDNLFTLGDSFLYSSDQDGALSPEEINDTLTHILEGLKNSRFLLRRISSQRGAVSPARAARALIQDQEILSPFLRVQANLSHRPQQALYSEKLLAVLKLEGERLETMDFLPLFVLLSAIEVNFYRLDKNRSLDLDENELIPFISRFEERLAQQLPYIYNSEQARAWLLHSFQTGDMPFLTGSASTPLEFLNRRLDPDSFSPVVASSNVFDLLILDFYKIYRDFSGP